MNDPGITLNIPPDNQDDVTIPNALQTPTTPQSAVAPAKRYRSTPAKTFQCTGFGDCRMVFSRSEHLARHIRSAFFGFYAHRSSPLYPSLFICSRISPIILLIPLSQSCFLSSFPLTENIGVSLLGEDTVGLSKK
jgi:hypothetical protein